MGLFEPFFLILWAAICGLAGFYTTWVVRVLFKDLASRGDRFQWFAEKVKQKPIICDVCMGCWGSLPWVFLLCVFHSSVSFIYFPLILAAAAGISLKMMMKQPLVIEG